MRSYISVPPIKDAADYAAFEYIIERCEHRYLFDEHRVLQEEIGEVGYVLPFTERAPFQNLLIDCVGEIPLFFMIKDEPQLFQQLLKLLDEQMVLVLGGLAGSKLDIIEFNDNLEGQMTNPKLFREYSLPAYQRYADLVHGLGIKIGSHTDGNLKSLLGLLKESGLDVCESISPAPLTPYTFDEVWSAWENGPIIWGAIPSPILEERTPEGEFQETIEHMLETINQPRIILGVADMMLPINDI
jgi:uroporphyrinogen-III decarboxylase